MTTIRVIAAKGLRVSYENSPRRYITDSEAVTVPKTVYYQRRINDGELVMQAEPAKKEEPQKDEVATKKGGK